MEDKIEIKNLELFAYHGCHEEEKEHGQIFILNATLTLDFSNVSRTDNLEDTVNYVEIVDLIQKLINDSCHNTIEHVATYIAREILVNFRKITTATIEISKPEVAHNFKCKKIGVSTHQYWHNVYISYGSNLGDSEQTINSGINDLANDRYICLVKDSTHIKTKPYCCSLDQPDFLNGCCEIKTLYHPQELLSYLQGIELKHGRERSITCCPRTLDLDILFYDQCIIKEENLIIPHYDIKNRKFVLEPLMEIDKDFIHPVLGKTIEELYENLKK